MWKSIQGFWKFLLAAVTVPTILFNSALLPAKYREALDANPWVVNMLTPWLLAAFFGGLLVLYVFWVDLRRYLDLNSWLDLEDAALYFRDQLREYPELLRAAQIFDAGNKDAGISEFLVTSFADWLKQGVDDGTLDVRGTPDHGIKPIKITEFRDPLESYSPEKSNRTLVLNSGVHVSDIQVKKTTIKDFVKRMREL